MILDLSSHLSEPGQTTGDYDRRTAGGREAGTTPNDDEEVFKNDPDAMKPDDLEGLDPDADMEEDDDDLLEADEEEDDSAENETLGTP